MTCLVATVDGVSSAGRELYSVGVQAELPDGQRAVLQVPINVGQTVKSAVGEFCRDQD